MTLKELSNNLKQYATSKGIEAELFQILTEHPEFIKIEQEKQLFVESIDAKGQPLGFYGENTYKMKGQAGKNPGTPFKMIDSGLFKNQLTVFVRGESVIITSFSPGLPEMLSNPFFESTDFFGLTGQHMGVVKRKVLVELKKRLRWKMFS